MKNLLRKLLQRLGLALENDWAQADFMWVMTLNHISYYLLNSQTDIKTKKNLVKLLVLIDPNKVELIDMFLNDWKAENITKEYKKHLNVICPMIIKELKRIEKESE